MFQSRFLLNAIAAAVMTLAFTSLAQAQSAQTFVSAQTGNDSSDCSLANPCRTFTRALVQVQAGGEITALDSGDYAPFTINKAVSVQAAPGVYAGITATSGTAVSVAAGSSDVVVLRGLTLNGMGATFGINAGGTVHIKNCVVNGFSSNGIRFQGGQLFVTDTVVRNSGSNGIHLSGVSLQITASIDRCLIEKNSLSGLSVSLSGSEPAKVTVRDTVSAGNGTGFSLLTSTTGTPAELNLENCVAANNISGIISQRAGAIVRVSNSTITNNSSTGVFASASGSLLSRGDNTVEGNTTNGNFTGNITAK